MEHTPHKYLIFHPLGDPEQQFFISHKDPEDTNIGQKLKHFMGKLGLKGYLSEEDKRPGVDLWKEKIPPAVTASIGVVILWTSNAANKPENIYRELELAKSCRRRLIMAPEHGVPVPDGFPGGIEYLEFNPKNPDELKRLAISIYEEYCRGGYS